MMKKSFKYLPEIDDRSVSKIKKGGEVGTTA